MKLKFSKHIFENPQMLHFIQILLVGAEFFHAKRTEGRTEGRTDGRMWRS